MSIKRKDPAQEAHYLVTQALKEVERFESDFNSLLRLAECLRDIGQQTKAILELHIEQRERQKNDLPSIR